MPARTTGSSPAPSHVYRAGRRDPSVNAGLETCRRAAAAGSSSLSSLSPSQPAAGRERRRDHERQPAELVAPHLGSYLLTGTSRARTRAPTPGARAVPPAASAPGAGDVGREQPLLERVREVRAAGEHHDLRVAVQRPRIEVQRAEAHLVVCHHDLRVDDCPRDLVKLRAGREQVGIAVLERRRGLAAVRLLRDHQPHLRAAPSGCEDQLDHAVVGDVGVHDVEPLVRAADLLADRLARRGEPARHDLRERDGDRAGVLRLGEAGGQVRRQPAAMRVEAAEERCLGLAHDVARESCHHVVEAAVLEVVLDPRAADPGDRAVDHVELAMVGGAELMLPRVEPQRVREVAQPSEREHVVDDDRSARRGEVREHRARLLVRLRPVTVDHHPDRDALGRLAREQCGERGPDLTLPPAEHQDVHGRARGLDFGEDAREELLAFDPRLRCGGRGPGEGKRRVASARPRVRREGLSRCLRAVRGDRVGRRRPARALSRGHHPAERRQHERGRARRRPRGEHRPPVSGHAGAASRPALRTLRLLLRDRCSSATTAAPSRTGVWPRVHVLSVTRRCPDPRRRSSSRR